jgi:hypothetical protein
MNLTMRWSHSHEEAQLVASAVAAAPVAAAHRISISTLTPSKGTRFTPRGAPDEQDRRIHP